MNKDNVDKKKIEFKVLSTTSIYKINSNYVYIVTKKNKKEEKIRIFNINYKDNICGDAKCENKNSIMTFIKKN